MELEGSEFLKIIPGDRAAFHTRKVPLQLQSLPHNDGTTEPSGVAGIKTLSARSARRIEAAAQAATPEEEGSGTAVMTPRSSTASTHPMKTASRMGSRRNERILSKCYISFHCQSYRHFLSRFIVHSTPPISQRGVSFHKTASHHAKPFHPQTLYIFTLVRLCA